MRAWLDGEEVTSSCFGGIFPNIPNIEEPGEVWLFRRDENGKLFYNGYRETETEIRKGSVRWNFTDYFLDNSSDILKNNPGILGWIE